MSECPRCEQSLTPEQKLAKYEIQLIEKAKARGKAWAIGKKFTGILHIHRTTNGFGFKTLEELGERKSVEAFTVY